MSTKTFLKLGLLLVLILVAATTAFAQGLATVYVDVTNGSDTYTGANELNSPFGTGPKSTLKAGLNALADNGKLIVVAGTYYGWDNLGGSILIDNTTASGRIVSGLTIEVWPLAGTTTAKVTAGNFTFDINGATLTFATKTTAESFVMDVASFTLGSTSNSCNIAIPTSSFFQLYTAATTTAMPTITMWNTSAFTSKAPTFGSNLNLVYRGIGTITAGPEAALTVGAGTLTVNKTSGVVTFAPAMTFTSAAAQTSITISGGDAVFSGAIVTGRLGSSSTTPQPGHIALSGTSNATFNAGVTLYNSGTNSNITNSGTGGLIFNGAVVWNAAYVLSGSGASCVTNSGLGTISFNSTVNFNTDKSTIAGGTAAATAYTFTGTINNTSSGTVTVASPGIALVNRATDATGNTWTYVISAVNSGTGNMTIGGSIFGNLTNSTSAPGTLTLNAATTVKGVITNITGKTIALGSNTLTITTAGTTAAPTVHLTNAGAITAGSGLVKITAGVMNFNGGTFPNVTITGGTVEFKTNAIAANSIAIDGGSLLTSIATTATGNMDITGTLTVGALTTVTGTSTVKSGGSLAINDGQTYKTLHLQQPAGTIRYGGSKVTAVTLSSAGSGYTSVPTVAISAVSGQTGSGASFTGKLVLTTVNTISATAGGTYSAVPLLTVVPATGGVLPGTTALASAFLAPTSVASVVMTTKGSVYATAPTVTFAPPVTGVTATGTAILGSGPIVSSVTVVAGGTGYVVGDVVTFSGGGATTQATGTVGAVAGGVITAITVATPGVGYTGTPSCSITSVAGAGAVLAAVMPASVVGVTITNAGSGYTTVPAIVFGAVGGSSGDVAAVAVLTPAPINLVTVTNAGAGYDLVPTITVANATAATNANLGYTANTYTYTGSGATFSVLMTPTTLQTPLTLVSGGVNYTSTPTVAISGGGAAAQAVGVASIVGGALTGTLEVTGDMNRTGGTFSALGGSKVNFTGNTQSINGGQLFQADEIKFNNTGGVITLAASVRAYEKITFSTGSNVDLKTFNAILNGTAGTSILDNSGQYSATGGGGVVMGGTNVVVGGAAGASKIRASSTGVFSNIIIDAGTAAGPVYSVVTIDGTSGGSVKFTGTLTLRSGQVDVNNAGGAIDFGPYGSSAKILRDVTNTGSALGAGPITTTGGATATFNTTNVLYDLEYTGTLGADVNAGTELNQYAKTWILNVDGDSNDDYAIEWYVLLSATANTPFSGALTINEQSGVKIPTNGAAAAFQLTGSNVTHTIKGELATVDAPDFIEVSGDNVVVNGSVTTEHAAKIGNVKFGSAVAARTATVNNVQSFAGLFTTLANSTVTLAMGSTTTVAATLATEQVITGAMSLGGARLTLASNIYPAGNVALTTGTLAFGNFNFQLTGGNFTQTSGSKFETTAGFLEMNNAALTSTLTLGTAVADALPNLRILNTTTWGAAGYVSGKLEIGSATISSIPTLDIGASNLNFTGTNIAFADDATGEVTVTPTGNTLASPTVINVGTTVFAVDQKVLINKGSVLIVAKVASYTLNGGGAGINQITCTGVNSAGANDITAIYTGGVAIASDGTSNGTGGGDLNITSTAVSFSPSGFMVEEMTFNPTGGTGTLTMAGGLDVLDMFTHSAGTVALGDNNIVFYGVGVGAATTQPYNRVTAGAGTITAGTGAFEFAGLAAQKFTGGTGFTIPNVKINNALGVSNDPTTNPIVVSKALDLTMGVFNVSADGILSIGNNATITRRAAGAALNFVPTFGTKVNLAYVITAATNANIPTAKEVPAAATVLGDLRINNPDIAAGPDPYNITLARNITVNGTLYLVAGELDVATFTCTMAAGSTINKGAGNFESVAAAADAPVVTSYNLVYSTGGAITSTAKEFQSGTGITVASLQILDDAVPAGTTLTLHASRTVGNLVLNTAGNALGEAIDLNAKNLTVTGNATLTSGILNNTGITNSMVIFGGTTAQAITVPATGLTIPTDIDLKLNNAAGFTMTGGNLTMATNIAGAGRATGGTIYFVNGVLATGSNSVILGQTINGQGFDRSGVTGTNVSHIFGKVRHNIPGGAGSTSVHPNGRFEYPVGTATLYRPLATTFTSTYPAINPTNVDVSMVDVSPAGRVGLPLDGGNGTRIGNYPGYYWLVATTPSSFSASQQFDVELQGTNLGFPFTSAGDLRIVRRQDGNADINPWQLQGTGASYQANYINVGTAGDSTIFVRSSSSLGGLVNQGSRFSIGIPTRPPVFTTAPPTASVDENALLTIQYTADPLDVGETVTYALVNPPAVNPPTINPTTGVMTWTPTYAQSGSYTLTVSASDGQFTVNTTTVVTVVNVNRKPSFAATGAGKLAASTIKDGQALAFSYVAVDPDADALTYVGVGLPTGATVSTAGALSWTPTFAQAGTTYTIVVVAQDASLTDTTSAVVTVNRSIARGDVDKNGTVGAADASLVLEHVAGIAVITDGAALFAADASNNGSISAYDAALILQASAGLVTLPASADMSLQKSVAVDAVGSLSWASPEAAREEGVVKINLNIANPANVYAVQLTSKVDVNLLTVEGVNVALPEGWQMQWNVVDNELRVAMAGATPLPSGSVAAIMVRLKNKESRLNFSTDAMLNENSQSLGAVEIAAVPTEFALQLNYPNPFNPSTTIKYQIANDANVNLDIWNLQGQKIRTLVGKEQKSGYYSVVWDGRNEAGQTVSTGLYLYRVQAGSFVATHKMLMIK